MRGRLKYFALLAFFAALSASGFSAYAQAPAASSSEPAPSVTRDNGVGGEWNGECPERQEIREERERIRAEAEELDAEHDRIKMQCMDSKGQERSECREKWDDLAAQRTALHERRRALKEKAEADPGCHHEHKNGQEGSWPSREQPPNTADGK